MNVKKILKFYLVLSLTMTGIFSLGYSDFFKNNFPLYHQKITEFSKEIFGGDDYKYLQKNSFASTLHVLEKNNEEQSKMRIGKQNFNFEIVNDVKKSFAKPGEKDLKIMEYRFQANDESLEIQSVKLKIVGTSYNRFDKLYIKSSSGKILSEGKIDNEFVEFQNINYKIGSQSSESLLFFADLSNDFKTGERFRLDLMSSEDMKIVLGTKISELNSYYPIEGVYISIAKGRETKTIENL